MSLLTIAELLAGEVAVTPGGPVDRVTATGDEQPLWMGPTADAPLPQPAMEAAALAGSREGRPVLASV